MATRKDKHGKAVQRVFYPTFDGGLNLAVPSESLAKNELKEALNVEFSPLTGALKVRGGLVWSGRFDSEIDCVVPVRGRRGFLARKKGTRTLYYFRWNNIWPVSGSLTGDGDLSIAAWDDEFVIASGGKLQIFSDLELPSLTTIDASPDECRFVFVRNGRVGAVSGDDTIRFSYVGDCEQWENDPDDESTGQFIEIGYKDGMNIDAVVPLSKDLVIFKSPKDEPDKGTIWRLTGEFPDWVLLEAAHNTGTFGMRSVQAVGDDVFYVAQAGVATLSSVVTYGEIKTSWPDRKIINSLTPLIDRTAQLWDVPGKQQLWLLPSDKAEDIWVLDYIRGIWTKYRFYQNPVYVAGVDNRLYVFIGRDLYEINDSYTQDEMKDAGVKTIEAEIKLGTLLTGRQVLIKGAFISFEIQPQCEAELKLKNFKMPFKYGADVDYIYDSPNDTQYASEDDDPLFPDAGTLTARRRCIVRDWLITPEIKIYGGGCSLSTMGLEMCEV